jgi:hypothetical protein
VHCRVSWFLLRHFNDLSGKVMTRCALLLTIVFSVSIAANAQDDFPGLGEAGALIGLQFDHPGDLIGRSKFTRTTCRGGQVCIGTVA